MPKHNVGVTASRMKILLLTDIPPCKDFTAGLVLDQLCRFLPRGAIACFAVVNPAIDAKLTPDLNWIPIAYTKKRKEFAFHPLPGSLSLPFAWTVETLRRRLVVPRLTAQAVAFGREQKADLLWAVLQGQTVTQMAPEIARKLGVPMVTQVWDPLIWWLLANRIDPFNRAAALRDFDRAVTASRSCVAASWAMAQEYHTRYGTQSVPVIASHASELGKAPDLSTFPGSTIKIGMAGQFYAGDEWRALLQALNDNDWRILGKEIEITVLGGGMPPGPAPEGRVRFLGWKSQPEAAEILSGMDMLYCPYPFAPEMEEVSKLSFPSKVVLYLAAGRPVLFHGPAYSSPADYLRRRNAGYLITEKNAAAVLGALCKLTGDPALYRELGENARKAFQSDFTLETMRANFSQAIGFPLPATPAATAPEPMPAPEQLPDVNAIFPATQSLVSRSLPIVLRLRQLAHAAKRRLRA
jgi:hypothetical protein